MVDSLHIFEELVCRPAKLTTNSVLFEKESQDYNACSFIVGSKKIHFRMAKITPKKLGQFVTFWKRKQEGTIEPFCNSDNIDFLVVQVFQGNIIGHFIFPKAILLSKKILSAENQEGKRAFRVYPQWSKPTSKQAIRTQKWQLQYFISSADSLNIEKVKSSFTYS